jgi:hypothetical protein
MTGSSRREPLAAEARPQTVRVIRPGHPLHGLDLPVWSRLRLRGADMAVLVLPDGRKKRVPAAWTSERGSTGMPAGGVVAAAGDLLRLLQVISGIPVTTGNRAEQAARQSPGKEDDHAARATQSAAGTGPGATITAGRPAAPASRGGGGRDPGAADHQGGRTGELR